MHVTQRPPRAFVAVVALSLLMTGASPAVAQGREVSRVTTRASRGPAVHEIGRHGARLPVVPGRAIRRARVPDPYIPGPGGIRAAPRVRGAARDARPPRRQGPAATATTVFAGMNQITSTTSVYGQGFPPDTIIARGQDNLIQMVNRRARLSTSAGAAVQTKDLNSFFGAVDANGNPAGDLLFDPKVVYDTNASNRRYYAVALQRGSTSRYSRVYVAISRSASPQSLASSQWCRFWFDARRGLGATTDTWADYPGLGVGRDGLVITTNQFDWSDRYVGSVVWAFNKLKLNANGASCPAVAAPFRWDRYTTGSGTFRLPFTMMPAQHYTSPASQSGVSNPVYLVNTEAGSARYTAWRVANLSTSSPLLWGPLVVTGNFRNDNLPDFSGRNDGRGRVPNGAGGFIITGDARMLQVAGRGNGIVGTHSVACQFTGGTAAETCVRTVRLTVGSTSSGAMTASLTRQAISGGGDGWHYFYPGVATNAAGTAVSAFDVVGPNGRLGVAWGLLPTTATTFSQASWLQQGTCALTATFQASNFGNRAGDYSGASADPDGVRVWVSSERAASISGVGCGWQTVVGAITP